MTFLDMVAAQRRLLRLRALSQELRDFSLVLLDRRKGFDLRGYLASIVERAAALELDTRKFDRAFRAGVRNLRAAVRSPTYEGFHRVLTDKKSLAPALELVQPALSKQEKLIAAIEPSVEKGRASLLASVEEGAVDSGGEALVLLAEDVSPSTVDQLEREWREARDYRASNSLKVTEIFWSSSLEAQEWDSIAMYRAWERFQFPGFDAAFAELESGYEDSVASATFWPHETRISAYNLWHVSRSRRLVERLAGPLTAAFQRAVEAQQSEGAWHLQRMDLPRHRRRRRSPLSIPDARGSALLCAALLRASDSERCRDAAVRAAKWLLSIQKPGGFWCDTQWIPDEPDLFVTVVALDAISRTDLPGVMRSVKSGRQWLLECQQVDGLWVDRSLPWPMASVLAVEAFSAEKRLGRRHDAYLSVALGFITKATQFAREDTPTSRRLAVIAASHAVEAFLYSTLSLPAVNISIWDKHDTIGMRAALTALQAHLQTKKLLNPNEVIGHRSQLGALQNNRDQVVHKAGSISTQECGDGVAAARAFIAKYGQQFHGFNVLE